MQGIELNHPIYYKHASLRFFNKGEHHVSRFCKDDVLLLIYDGILRFSEDGVPYELHAGTYHIQRHDSVQEGLLPSESPKYLYVHFLADWNENDTTLPRSGTFDPVKFMSDIEALDRMAHHNMPYVLQAGKFFDLLSKLYRPTASNSVAEKMADYIAEEFRHEITLEKLCSEFHFSKNHIIALFKKEFGTTPIAYANHIKLQKAEYLMELTSDPIESIAIDCGFHDYSHFYKLFLRKHGLTPKQWRVQKRIGP